jgi:hypothetical protein
VALIDLARAELTRSATRCAFGKWFDTLDDGLRAEVRELLVASDLGHDRVAEVLVDHAASPAFHRKVIPRHRPHAYDWCAECKRARRLS